MAQSSTREPLFTETLRQETRLLFDEILSHPFVRGLTTGDLAPESFRFYVIQDALFLREFARALSIAAAKAPTEDIMMMFNEHAIAMLRDEKSLHVSFFEDWNITETEMLDARMAPTNTAYTNYLLAVAHTRPFHETLAALLPCYWIYGEVGKTLQARGSTEPAYQRWIETYAGDAFTSIVRTLITLTDTLGTDLGARERESMRRHFITTSRYEWMFWEMGYRREAWPILATE